MRSDLIPPLSPCVVSHNLALGGAQIAVLRMLACLPDWVRERTTLYVQSDDSPLLASVEKHGLKLAAITTEPPHDPSCWVLSYGNLKGLARRPTSLILHSWDDEGWRYVHRAYGDMRGLTVAGVSQQVLGRFAPWIAENGHHLAGILPPPVTQLAMVKGEPDPRRIVVAWMGRPLESKGLLALPYLLKLDPRLVIRCFTGAETGGHPYTRRTQAETMDKLVRLCAELGVADRLDLRPLEFDPFNYAERLRGCHALLGNSRREGFLMTAAEALSSGVPVVVTRTCGVADFVQDGVNGRLIDWHDDPAALAKEAYPAILQAIRFSSFACLRSVQKLSIAARYRQTYGQALSRIFHASVQCDPQLDGGEARVTVGLRIHKGMRIDHLDQAISSLALQTYRRFNTLLLVDGPWAYGEKLAERYQLPLICTGQEPDITHCSWLHRQAVEQCETEFYKPLDYDDQLLPGYLQRAVATLDESGADVYGCLLLTLDEAAGEYSARAWPHKPLSTMFTGNSGDNMLPHSSVLMRRDAALRAGNYQEKAIGLGADDYNLWYRLYKAGAQFVRDDAVRNVAYRIHEKNSLKLRRARYGGQPQTPTQRGKLTAAAAAASIAVLASPALNPAHAAPPPAGQPTASQADASTNQKKQDPALERKDEAKPAKKDGKSKAQHKDKATPDDLLPPHS